MVSNVMNVHMYITPFAKKFNANLTDICDNTRFTFCYCLDGQNICVLFWEHVYIINMHKLI